MYRNSIDRVFNRHEEWSIRPVGFSRLMSAARLVNTLFYESYEMYYLAVISWEKRCAVSRISMPSSLGAGGRGLAVHCMTIYGKDVRHWSGPGGGGAR